MSGGKKRFWRPSSGLLFLLKDHKSPVTRVQQMPTDAVTHKGVNAHMRASETNGKTICTLWVPEGDAVVLVVVTATS